MTLETTIMNRLSELSSKIAVLPGRIEGDVNDVTCGVYLDQDGRLKIDFVGPDFNEAADSAIPTIDALFSTVIDLEGDEGRVRVAYAHGLIIRGAHGEPVGYQCIFEQEAAAASDSASSQEKIPQAA